jgi:hypothetical protein
VARELSLLLVTLRSPRGNDRPSENRHFRPTPLNFAPPHHLSTASLRAGRKDRSHSIAIFASFFRYFSRLDQTNFSRFRRTLSTDFDCWLCYFHYLRPGGLVAGRRNTAIWLRATSVISAAGTCCPRHSFHLSAAQLRWPAKSRKWKVACRGASRSISTPLAGLRDLADFASRHGDAPRFARKGREIEPALRSDRTLPKPTWVARCPRSGAPPLRVT